MSAQGAIITTIPDLILLDALQKGLVAVRADYNSVMVAGTGSKNINDTWIGMVFNGVTQVENFNFINTVIQAVITTPQNRRHITPSLSYNRDSSKYPSITITMPSESDQVNTLGIGEGDQPEIYDGVSGMWRVQYARSFNATYQIIVISDNKNEALALYHLTKSLIVAMYDSMILQGINNLKMSGGDISFRPDVPDATYMRNIGLNLYYTITSAPLILNQVINTVNVIIDLEASDSWDGYGPVVAITH